MVGIYIFVPYVRKRALRISPGCDFEQGESQMGHQTVPAVIGVGVYVFAQHLAGLQVGQAGLKKDRSLSLSA